jgi:hypothetical protein
MPSIGLDKMVVRRFNNSGRWPCLITQHNCSMLYITHSTIASAQVQFIELLEMLVDTMSIQGLALESAIIRIVSLFQCSVQRSVL